MDKRSTVEIQWNIHLKAGFSFTPTNNVRKLLLLQFLYHLIQIYFKGCQLYEYVPRYGKWIRVHSYAWERKWFLETETAVGEEAMKFMEMTTKDLEHNLNLVEKSSSRLQKMNSNLKEGDISRMSQQFFCQVDYLRYVQSFHRFTVLWRPTWPPRTNAKKDILFSIGDWNEKVGSQEIPGVTGKFGLGVQNEAGQRLTEFCQEDA